MIEHLSGVFKLGCPRAEYLFMRIDLLLKYICLLKSRSSAGALCQSGKVILNARRTKPSSEVREGDRISLEKESGTQTVEIIKLPSGQVGKKDVYLYYKTMD